MELNETLRWLLVRGLALLIGIVVVMVIYRIGVAGIHRFVPAVITAQATHLPSGSGSCRGGGQADQDDRGAAPEAPARGRPRRDPRHRAGRLRTVDHPGGHRPCHRGDRLRNQGRRARLRHGVPDPRRGPVFQRRLHLRQWAPGVEGVVEEIGLRRTLLRDATGASHAVSNAFIRISSNLTRLFSVAVVDLHVLHAAESRSGARALRPVSGASFEETPRGRSGWPPSAPIDVWITGIGLDGASIRLQQRVPTGAQVRVASELRRRLATAYVAESIATGRWDTPLPIVTQAVASPLGG